MGVPDLYQECVISRVRAKDIRLVNQTRLIAYTVWDLQE